MTWARLQALFGTIVFFASCSRHQDVQSAKLPSDESSIFFEDSYFRFEYPPEFVVSGTKPATPKNMTPSFGLDLKIRLRNSPMGSMAFQPDALYPDMVLRDAAETAAKDLLTAGGRIFGSVRKLAVKNGSCIGFVATGPNRKCPDNVGFTTPSGKCFDVEFWSFCESPKGKHFVMTGDLGFVPTPDKLTPEAIQFGKIHEHILSTLEFK